MDSTYTNSADTFTLPPKQPILKMQDANDITKSQIMNMFPMNTSKLFMSGYADCAHVAIRFLLEEVGLSYSHPLVVGLFEHLSEHEKLLHIQHLLKSANLYEEPEKESGLTGDPSEANDDQKAVDEDRGSSTDAGEVSESDTSGTDPGPGETDKLVTDLAKYLQILCMLEVEDDSEDDDTQDSGFED